MKSCRINIAKILTGPRLLYQFRHIPWHANHDFAKAGVSRSAKTPQKNSEFTPRWVRKLRPKRHQVRRLCRCWANTKTKAGWRYGNIWVIYGNIWIIYGYGWCFSPTPLKNMSSSILMIIYSQLNGKIQVMFQSPPTGKIHMCHGQNQRWCAYNLHRIVTVTWSSWLSSDIHTSIIPIKTCVQLAQEKMSIQMVAHPWFVVYITTFVFSKCHIFLQHRSRSLRRQAAHHVLQLIKVYQIWSR